MLSSRGLCAGLIINPEEPYRLWCMSECGHEASIMSRFWPAGGGAVGPWEEKAIIRQIYVRVLRPFHVNVMFSISILIHLSLTRYKLSN